MNTSMLCVFALASAFTALPAVAEDPNSPLTSNQPVASGQTAPASEPDNTQGQQQRANKPEIGTATITPTGLPPSQRNPLLTDNGNVRIGKLVGTNIYNKDDHKIGTVDDVLADQNGQVQVVVATGDKKVLLPWDKLVFGDAKLSSDNKVLIPDGTQDALNKMPTFTYQNRGQ
jgi:sporulation protein YlmC with PRC-barrel domain